MFIIFFFPWRRIGRRARGEKQWAASAFKKNEAEYWKKEKTPREKRLTAKRKSLGGCFVGERGGNFVGGGNTVSGGGRKLLYIKKNKVSGPRHEVSGERDKKRKMKKTRKSFDFKA